MSIWRRWWTREGAAPQRQLFVGTLCDDGTAHEEHVQAAQQLLQAPSRVGHDEMQHFMMYLAHENLKPEHVALFLDLIARAIEAHPEYSSYVASEMAMEIWRRLCANEDPRIQMKFCDVLKALNIPNRVAIEERLVDLMLWVLECESMEQDRHRSLVAQSVLRILARRFDIFVFDNARQLSRICTLAMNMMINDPFNRTTLKLVFLFVEKLVHLLGSWLSALYGIFHDILTECLSNIDPARIKFRNAAIYLCLGGMSCIAIEDPARVNEVTHYIVRHLPNFAIMIKMIPREQFIRRGTALKIVSSIMKLLTQAAQQDPTFVLNAGSILWQPGLRDQDVIRREVRFILMESSEPIVPQRFALFLCSEEQLAKVFRYHGIHEEICARCTMTGSQFIRDDLAFYQFQSGLSRKQQAKLQQMRKVYRCMVTITGNEACDRVTSEEMERVLQGVPDPRYKDMFRSLQDEDRHYYFDDLMRGCNELVTICGSQSDV